MKTPLNTIKLIALVATLVGAGYTGIAHADVQSETTKLLTANFASRQVVQVEVGDFHFRPGQTAPIHTHEAPAVGYVAKGAIIYQVEGEKPQVLREGDVFFEPTDKRILRFDNASATQEAIFLDFNLQQVGEPFIVFEENPTEAIDRRTLPTIKLAEESVDQVEIFTSELASGGSLKVHVDQPTLGIVSEGVIELQIDGKVGQRIAAGGSFALPIAGSKALFKNASSEVLAKVITFRLSES